MNDFQGEVCSFFIKLMGVISWKGGCVTIFKENKLDEETKKKEHSNIIFRPYITTKNGRKIYAKNYGLKAFKIKL